MQLLGTKVQCVGKKSREWDDGSVNYEIQLSNGFGGIMSANCTKNTWESIEPFTFYDMSINVDTNGYKHYPEVQAFTLHED